MKALNLPPINHFGRLLCTLEKAIPHYLLARLQKRGNSILFPEQKQKVSFKEGLLVLFPPLPPSLLQRMGMLSMAAAQNSPSLLPLHAPILLPAQKRNGLAYNQKD